jgi:hypothetical protein
MNMKNRLIISVSVALLMAGCAPPMPVVKETFYGQPRALDSIAIIKRSLEKAEFQATLSQYAPPPTWVALKTLDPNTVELRVDPGEYVVVLHCTSGSTYADPRTTIKARAGMTYEVACERNTFTGNEVRAKVSNTYQHGSASEKSP